MAPRLRPVWNGARVSAPAFPVTCSTADNLAIHVAVAEAPAGSVLVVNVGHEPARGYWGEVLTTGAEARGIVGLVIDGGVRDVDALEAHGFPVFSTMIALRGATKQEPGWVGRAVDGRRRRGGTRRLDRRRRRRRHRRAQRAPRRRARRGPRTRGQGREVLRGAARRAAPRSSCSRSTMPPSNAADAWRWRAVSRRGATGCGRCARPPRRSVRARPSSARRTPTCRRR